MCPCLIEGQPHKKVAKGILTLDAEGDMYPDDFLPKRFPDQTEEDEALPSQGALNLNI
jgi:hypothetical protein